MIAADERSFVAALDDVAARADFTRLTADHDLDGSFPWPVWEALVSLGVPALELPEDMGGFGCTARGLARITERLAFHSIAASTAHFTFSGFGTHVFTTLDQGHPLRGLLPGIAKGSVRTALSLTEPGGGSDLSDMRTRLRCDVGRWILHGSKMFTTLAGEGTHLIVGALTGSGSSSWRERFALAVIPVSAPGVSLQRVATQALRTCPTYEISYAEVGVDEDCVILPPTAVQTLNATLNKERLAVAAQSCGLATRSLEVALRYATLRTVWGSPLLDKQVTGMPWFGPGRT